MLYDLVAEFYGIENDSNLQMAVDASGTSLLDWLDGVPSEEVREKMNKALTAQTDKMIADEIASGANRLPLEEMLFQLSQMPGIRVTGLPNRKSRRAAKKKA